MEQLIIGTAGHVDHGKTELIKALTGVDTDRFQEEKERGISIDLGFAPFCLPGGRQAGIVDVPGHERFIHNMLAGAAGMDLVMLVVDASEGVMPQTREHLDILQLLGLTRGLVVISKIDLVEEEWQELVEEEIREELQGTFLKEAPMVAVSAITGQGIEELRNLLDEMSASLADRDSAGPLRLPVDRSFVIPGFGTVVTGTLVRGSVSTGETVAVVPPGLEARVRNIQVHDLDVTAAAAGSRVALNLSGLEKSEIVRGSVVCAPGFFHETALLDLSLELLPRASRPLRNMDPLHFFLGTARSTCRVVLLNSDELMPGEGTVVQCRLDRPLVAERGDPFVVRSYSPMTTIGGGKVLDPHPERHRRFRADIVSRLEKLRQAPAEEQDAVFTLRKLEEMVVADRAGLAGATRLHQEQILGILEDYIDGKKVCRVGNSYMVSAAYTESRKLLVEAVAEYHRIHPLSPGLSRARLKGFLPGAFAQQAYEAFLRELQEKGDISIKGELVSAHNYEPSPDSKDSAVIENLTSLYKKAGLQPPAAGEALGGAGVDSRRREEFLAYLVSKGVLVKAGEDLFFHQDPYGKALAILRRHFAREEKLTLAVFRDLSETSRKYAQALLEHFDRLKLTKRVGDYRLALKIDTFQGDNGNTRKES